MSNLPKATGVIYAKPVRTADGKKGTKNEGKTFEFPSIILEIKEEYGGKTFTDLPEFELGRGLNLEQFEVGDHVEITYKPCGRKISDHWHKTYLRALYIRHTDINGNDGLDVSLPAKEKDTFEAVNPYDNDGDTDDLPF